MAKWDFGNDSVFESDEKNIPFVFNPLEIKRTYGVVLLSENEKHENLQVHYKIDVICLDKQDEHCYIFELQKHQTYINDKKPNTVVDELSERCGAILYPLEIAVNRSGEVIGVTNQEFIRLRWQIEKKRILQSYKGDQTQQLIQSMDAIVCDANQLSELLLKRDWFIHMFFAPIYGNKKKSNIKFPIIPYAPPIAYQLKRKLTKHISKEGDVIVNFKGNCSDSRSEKDILRGNIISLSKDIEEVSGKCNFNYHIYKSSPTIDSITGSIGIDFPSGKKKKITIELYNLKNEQPLTAKEKLQEQEKNKLEEPQADQKKKKYFLFGKEIKFGK